jgi:hypothetical protein
LRRETCLTQHENAGQSETTETSVNFERLCWNERTRRRSEVAKSQRSDSGYPMVVMHIRAKTQELRTSIATKHLVSIHFSGFHVCGLCPKIAKTDMAVMNGGFGYGLQVQLSFRCPPFSMISLSHEKVGGHIICSCHPAFSRSHAVCMLSVPIALPLARCTQNAFGSWETHCGSPCDTSGSGCAASPQRLAWSRLEGLMPGKMREAQLLPTAQPHIIDRAKPDSPTGYFVWQSMRRLVQEHLAA